MDRTSPRGVADSRTSEGAPDVARHV